MMHNVSKLFKFTLLADETALNCSLGKLLSAVEKELKVLKKWFDMNTFSPEKRENVNHI